MAVFKCKMCGGTIEFEPGSTVGVCDSCGTKQTLPRLDDDRKANLYDRANHFRRNNDFDKAMGIYETILNDDNTDAEAYWSLVLCRYGIEYVEDPETHKRIPTVNRAQYTSIFRDEDYKSALKYADAYQRDIYEQEARTIDDIQKGILEISKREEPFDVFICYKETDANGKRTPDAVLANDLYHQLTREGFKVFFRGITLENKLGTAYEPYIFAALNSAKVMVVLGTKPEYFNAVWVKNEWSRYLALVKKSGGKKVLIPAYKDMDPYGLPEEFSHLMAQDMSKLGFMQDLIRGIKKITSTDEPKATVKETSVLGESRPAITPFLERSFLFIEDGNWQSADEYCEKVLDQDPKNAYAYLAKLMMEFKIHTQAELADLPTPFDNSGNFKKAIRFGDRELVDTLNGYIDHINERNENSRKTGIYNAAIEKMNSAATEEAYKAAAEKFASISGFKDADEKGRQCLGKAEEFRAAAEERRIAEEQRRAREKSSKKKPGSLSTAICIIAAAVTLFFLITKMIIPNVNYNNAVELMESGNYEEAIAAFKELDGYKDSAEKIQECSAAILEAAYNNAIALMGEGKYEEAIAAFEALNEYKDSADKITECSYEIAIELKNTGKYENAIAAFEALDGYKDSASQVGACERLNAKVGDYIYFGSYEQDNNAANGKEDIEWLVLDKQDDKILVISKYGLDAKPYNKGEKDITWEKCTLRSWLNKDFYNSAFSAYEKQSVFQTTVSADKNPEYSTDPGNSTTDNVFLLSINEANKYFSSDSARQCAPTDYAIAQGAYANSNYKIDGKAACWWWLRSPGGFQSLAASVLSSGSVYYEGGVFYDSDYNIVSFDRACVRPALWINLEA